LYNQQQQSYQTANYRGNQAGHDQYLRSDSQQPTSFGVGGTAFASGSFGAPVASQYKGLQKTYQPTGYVQSVYGQNQQQQSYGQQQFQSPSSFYTANYRGNQPGHDQYLRADSTQPSSFASATNTFSNQYQPTFNNSQFGTVGSQYQSQFYQPQFQNTQQQQFHNSNYQGNQPGHDQYLRADSTQPSQIGRNVF